MVARLHHPEPPHSCRGQDLTGPNAVLPLAAPAEDGRRVNYCTPLGGNA